MIQELMGQAVYGFFQLPSPLLSTLAGRPVRLDQQDLDTQLPLLLRLMALRGGPQLHELSPEDGRRLFADNGGMLPQPSAPMHRVDDWIIPGPGGEIPVRVYTPTDPAQSASGSLPLTVFYHGGGWVIGSLDTHDGVTRAFAEKSGSIVVSVDYRLAPEHRFPSAVEDAEAAYLWALKAAQTFGGDPDRIAVAGDSAGGNLAAAVAQLTRDRAENAPRFQLLIYPVMDLSAESMSYATFSDGFFLSRDMMRWFRANYLSDTSQGSDPRASPLLADDLAGLAPTFVVTAGFDPLRDEGRAYAEKLNAAGVGVEYRNYPGLIHGFVAMYGLVEAAGRAFDDAANAVKTALAD